MQTGPPASSDHRPRPIVVIAIVFLVVIVAVLGYGIVGYAYAQAKINDAQTRYNAVVNHQNSLTDTITSLDTSLADVSGNASASSIQQEKGTVGQMITKSQDAQHQIAFDDASLASATDSLSQNSWLTVLRKPDIDKAHTRIDHLRNALAIARSLAADYVQVGNFEQTLLDVVSDIDDLAAKLATDPNGAATADAKLKADIDKAISSDKAPGLPASVDELLQDLKTLANDFGTLIADQIKGDSAGAQNANAAVQADGAKVDAIDEAKINSDIKAFYASLVAQYNAEIDRANNT